MKTAIALFVLLLFGLPASEPVRAQDMYGYAYDWTGLYAGIYGGAGIVRLDDGAGTELSSENDILGGLSAGYLRQLGSFVLGADAEIGLSGLTELFDGTAPAMLEVNALGSVRGRVGFAFDLMQLYATAGIGFGLVSDGTPLSPESGWLMGWTAGIGGAYAITDGISLDLRYLHTELGPATIGSSTTEYGVAADTIRAGINFRF